MNMETTTIPKLLLKMSPPIMLALLIQAIYNIADSFLSHSTHQKVLQPYQLFIRFSFL